MSENCVFCKIIKGEIPSYKIYENEYVYAFLDIACDYYGHTLVVPKKHFQNVLDCDDKYLCEVIKAVQKISNHYVKNCGFNAVNLFNINEDVQHFHIHIIPRKSGDGIKILKDAPKQNFDLQKIFNVLKLN